MQEFEALYTKYNQYIYRFLLKLTGYNPDLADELTQETFYQVFLSLHRYRGDSGVLTWICSIAKNVCCKHYQKNPQMVDLNKVEPEAGKSAGQKSMEEAVEQKEQIALVVSEIMKLGEKYRDVLIYRLFFELSFREIGEIMGIKENSAKVLYHRGRRTIRVKLEGYFNE